MHTRAQVRTYLPVECAVAHEREGVRDVAAAGNGSYPRHLQGGHGVALHLEARHTQDWERELRVVSQRQVVDERITARGGDLPRKHEHTRQVHRACKGEGSS